MFVLVATALAGNLIGWPCQRLNWGWRNVWSTCSINSYAPAGAGFVEPPNQVPTGFRQTNTVNTPSIVLHAGGYFLPNTGNVPNLLCTNAAATGSGSTQNLRNRCRRAVDAYGALVKSCQLPPLTAGNRGPAGPNSISPDFAPNIGHLPHVSNVLGLTTNAQFCTMPTGARTPNDLATPSTTCPGLLGWFTVVFNACGFSNAPGMAPAFSTTPVGAPWTANYFPVGSIVTPNVLGVATVGPATGVGYFCTAPSGAGSQGPNGAVAPSAWNLVGSNFRTSRCRKALDQFGRTAQRCATSTLTLSGPAQAGGYSDPLRFLAVGAAPNAVPNGINTWAPACNT